MNYGVALNATSAAANTLQPLTAILPATAFLNLPTNIFANTYYSGNGLSATAVTLSGSASSILTDLTTAAKWFGNSGTAATFPTYTFNFDVTRPTVSSLLSGDDSTNASFSANLIATFNENIAKGTGHILFKETSDNSTAFTIDVTNEQVTISGAAVTIDPSTTLDLDSNTEYYVQIPATAVTDIAGNAFAGITDTTSWSFTTASAADVTAPTVTRFSPVDNATGVALNTDLFVTFSENVVKGTGNILVKRTIDDVTVQTIDVVSGIVTIGSNVVTINPSTDFLNNIGYYVEIPNTAFKDPSNNFYVGTTDKNTWNFTTVADTTPPTVLTIDDGDADNTVTTNVTLTYTITFSEDIDHTIVTAADFDNAG